MVKSRSKPNETDEHAAGGGEDGSMDTILASIRRILNEDEIAPAETAPDRAGATDAERDDVFVLRDSMMVQPERIEPVLTTPPPIPPVPASATPPAPEFPPTPAQSPASIEAGLVAARTRAAAAQSFDALHEALRRDQEAEMPEPSVGSPRLLRAGGPTLEDLVREELRGLLGNWLDVHLPPLVESLVRLEIAKLTRRN